ncbi:hypothetical protein QFZ20_002104 [Flavobacterium sp. W4I14]|nr:hypothetical protein [Flavobacterium sp. W4I14]
MKDNGKNKDHKKQGEENCALSLEEEIIKALEKKNEQIESGEQQDHTDNKGKKSSGFDEWSVSWP